MYSVYKLNKQGDKIQRADGGSTQMENAPQPLDRNWIFLNFWLKFLEFKQNK